FEAGASDVFLTSVMMKKGRPGIVLSIIAEKGLAGTLSEILFTESTTLGIRSFPFMKETLSREFIEYETPFGKVKFKHSFYKGKEVSVKPENEDCKRIAGETGKPLGEVYNILMDTVRSKKRQNE
ncbi:MAG: LarC family nickel insertion protein, partial [Bacteroidales bacterium]|nr:LarC family nickel insertion protein [Bacteroidales bacterium]